jgi:2-polyprenyl-3-methyl-5-hydroxy-6-metoxy-1,4-benzoquinol methylase
LKIGDTDRDWEHFGKDDAYYAVLTEDKYKKDSIQKTKKDFFKTGEDHIAFVFDVIKNHINTSFKPKRSMDFGCGVGRLTIPIARRSKEAIGLDISSAMLSEAKQNADDAGIRHIIFARSDDTLSNAPGKFDFINSFIVFQHMPVWRGESILRLMIEKLNKGGIAALQFTYASNKTRVFRLFNWIRLHVPFSQQAINLLRGRPLSQPAMQMNDYSLNNLLKILQNQGIHTVHATFTENYGYCGVILFFQK